MVKIKRESRHENVPRFYAHAQYRFVRGVGEIDFPELLELRSELGKFRWLGSPLDARAETAVSMVNQKVIKKVLKCLAHFWAMRPFPVFSNSAVAARGAIRHCRLYE